MISTKELIQWVKECPIKSTNDYDCQQEIIQRLFEHNDLKDSVLSIKSNLGIIRAILLDNNKEV